MNITITYKDIMDKKPCYDPVDRGYCNKDWQGSLVDILEHKDIPADDKIWLVTHFLDDKTNSLFAVWCAREALKLIDDPDLRSINACNVAEAYALGKASKKELDAARAAVWAAARDARVARDAAWDAARAAVWAAARDARDARDAARAAVWAAARDARVARDAAWDAQVKQLIKMIKQPVEA